MANDFKNSLIVPIRLDALAANSRFTGKPVRRWRMNYFQLLRQNNPEPSPFAGEIEEAFFDKSANWGVYLHWIVPEALRKGVQEGEEEADRNQVRRAGTSNVQQRTSNIQRRFRSAPLGRWMFDVGC